MQRPARAICLMLLLTLVVSGCGLHLRGQQKAPIDSRQTLAIDGGNRYGELAAEIRRQAQTRSMQINPDADWRIRLDNVEHSQWLASSNPGYSRNEYWLSLSVELIVRHKEQNYQPITLQRQLLFKDDTDELNSKAYEKQMIITDLQRRLAAEILQVTAGMIENPPDCNCSDDEN